MVDKARELGWDGGWNSQTYLYRMRWNRFVELNLLWNWNIEIDGWGGLLYAIRWYIRCCCGK